MRYIILVILLLPLSHAVAEDYVGRYNYKEYPQYQQQYKRPPQYPQGQYRPDPQQQYQQMQMSRQKPKDYKYYIRGDLIYVMLHESSLGEGIIFGGSELDADSGFGISGALGYQFAPALFAEIELDSRAADVKNSITNTTDTYGLTSIMLNGLFDINRYTLKSAQYLPPMLRNYGIDFGLGIGMGSYSHPSDSKTVIAFKVLGGLSYWFNNRFAIRTGWQWTSTRGTEFETLGKFGDSKFSGHNFTLGAKYRF